MCFPLETGVQELRQSFTRPEKNRRDLCAAPQDHRLLGGVLRCGSDPGSGPAQRRGQLHTSLGHAGRAVLPPACRRPSQALRPRAGLRHPTHLPVAHCPAGRRAAWEGREQGGAAAATSAAYQWPRKEQGQAVLKAFFVPPLSRYSEGSHWYF